MMIVRHFVAVLVAVVLALTGCASSEPAPPPPEMRTITVAAAGDFVTLTYTCGPDGQVCTQVLGSGGGDGDGSWSTQITMPVGSTVRAQVEGIPPMSCWIADATGRLEYVKHIPEIGEKAKCVYVVE